MQLALIVAGAVAAVFGAVVFFNGSDRAAYEFRPEDPWYRPPSNEAFAAPDFKELERTMFGTVSVKQAESLARLEKEAWVELSPKETEELTGHALGGTGGRLVLMRALSWDTPHGAFTVRWRAGAVRVSHGCLGRRPLPIVRRAVVARLPDLPINVFVDVWMVE